jgi:peptidoglycan hydrolase CwlO-like protein
VVVASVLAVVTVVTSAGVSRGDLASRYSTGQQRAGQLRSVIKADSSKIQGFEGTISSLQARLTAVQQSLDIQEQQLEQVTAALSSAQRRLVQLQRQLTTDRRILASQLIADYESPTPNLVDVIVESRGWNDLVNEVGNLTAIAKSNARTMRLVITTRAAVEVEARRLAGIKIRRQQTTMAVRIERDNIAQLRLSIVDRELRVARDRSAKRSRLTKLQKTLAHEAQVLDAQAAAAGGGAGLPVVPPPGGCINTAFVPHGGSAGFFPAPGTNYSVNQEPVIAARLDALGRALGLHLIGISGYRSPAHSVEVGGFADDPHTRGEASDTPGVEGVPEATLEEFCLTRPFPGAREADHIQEL